MMRCTLLVILSAAGCHRGDDDSGAGIGQPELRVLAQEAWGGYNHGIRWEASLDAAKVRAAREGKPILFHQLVGDLDREGC